MNITYDDLKVDPTGAILNNEHHGFVRDYLVLHHLLRTRKPKSVFEVGTNCGLGTLIICNAVPEANVYSLDLAPEQSHLSKQYPNRPVGHRCHMPYTQLLGDSMTFDYAAYPCEAYFIDGEHDYGHVLHETLEAFVSANLIIWHDADIPAVWWAIKDVILPLPEFQLVRVTDTRIAFATRKP